MPVPGKMWRHVIISTRGSWLHGDARGFRDRKHRIHSSGDYKNPPPVEEHAGLHRYMKEKSSGEVHIPRSCRPLIGRAIIAESNELGHRVLAVAVNKTHAHAVTELPSGVREVRAIVGEAKRVSSRAVKDKLPGSVWGAGG